MVTLSEDSNIPGRLLQTTESASTPIVILESVALTVFHLPSQSQI